VSAAVSGYHEILVVSLGIGQHTRPIHYRDAKNWGLALWAKPILNVVFDGVSDTVDHQMKILCRDSEDGDPRYYRFQTELDSRQRRHGRRNRNQHPQTKGAANHRHQHQHNRQALPRTHDQNAHTRMRSRNQCDS
jgi:hypothetical protein